MFALVCKCKAFAYIGVMGNYMKNKLFAILTLITLSTGAQNVTLFSDTLHVGKYYSSSEPDLDTIIYIVDDNRYNVSWKVYFDQNKTKLALESIIQGDTCVEHKYWRENGNIKTKTKYYKSPEYKLSNDAFDVKAVYEEIYCKNGQLIRKCNPNYKKTEHIINFYCNGNKKNEFTFVGMHWEGAYTVWYGNGQKESEGYYIKTKKNGEWKYWTEKGELILLENYKDGEIIETKK